MARTHHATRTFRLSCGCLRDYPGMAIGKVHHVLCPACEVPAHTITVYPTSICGVEGSSHDHAHLMCSEPPGTNACTHGLHHDKEMNVRFRAAPALRARRAGETRRA